MPSTGSSDRVLYTHGKNVNTVTGSTTISVTAAVDDGHCNNATAPVFSNSANWVTMGRASTNYYSGFFRFDELPIPRDAIITSAKATFQSVSNQSVTSANFNIYFCAEDDADPPSDVSTFNGKPLTSAVAWNNVGGWATGSNYDTPELKDILQEVVNRDGWSSGQAVCLMVNNNNSTNGAYRQAKAYNGYPTAAVVLTVTYTEVGTNRRLYVEGLGVSSADRFLYSKGISTGSSDRGLYTRGKLADTSDRLLYTKSSASSSSDRLLYSEGSLTSSSDRLLYTEGSVSASSDRGLYSKGIASSDSDRLVYTKGTATSSSDRAIYSEGKVGASSDRLIHTLSEALADSQRGIYTRCGTIGAGKFKRYNGSAWVEATVKRYNGSGWVSATVKHYSGSTWEEIN